MQKNSETYKSMSKVATALPITWWSEIKALTKFKLSMMVLMSSIFGYMIVAGTQLSLNILLLLTIGGFLITAAANILNQVLEREYDALMDRTKNRPLAANRMKVSEAVLLAGISMVIGIGCLAVINPLTAFLGTLSLILYAFVYTPLKRYSTISVAVGAIPGALPVLIGTTAFEGNLSVLGLTLFGIQFLWQFPHFWAIGWLSFEDYKKAGYKLLPINIHGKIDDNIGMYSGIYAFLLIPVCLFGMLGDARISLAAFVFSTILNLAYFVFCLQLQKKKDRKSARGLMFSSFFYLPFILLIFLIF